MFKSQHFHSFFLISDHGKNKYHVTSILYFFTKFHNEIHSGHQLLTYENSKNSIFKVLQSKHFTTNLYDFST